MALRYRLLNIVDSIDTFNALQNKNNKSLYFVKNNDTYVAYIGNVPINIETMKPATDSSLGIIKGSDYITIKHNGEVIVNKSKKLARKIKLGEAYFDGGTSISLKDMGAVSLTEFLQYKDSVTKLFSIVDSNTESINTRIDDLFQSVSNGKTAIAEAITDKGVATSATDTFTTMATNISNIQAGIDTSDATAVATDILKDKTAYIGNTKIIGTMESYAKNSVNTIPTLTSSGGIVDKGYINIYPTTDKYIETGASFIYSDANFLQKNIRKDVSIFGMVGTLEYFNEYKISVPSGQSIYTEFATTYIPKLIVVIYTASADSIYNMNSSTKATTDIAPISSDYSSIIMRLTNISQELFGVQESLNVSVGDNYISFESETNTISSGNLIILTLGKFV